MSHVTCDWDMPNMNESCRIWMSHVTYKSHYMWLRHDKYEWVISHMNESVMSHIDESCHIWMSHVTYEWVMSHINESRHMWLRHAKYEWRRDFISKYESCRTCTNLFASTPLPKNFKWFQNAAYCISSVISQISNLNRLSSSLCFFCHVLLKRAYIYIIYIYNI